jgi:MFS family permease
MLSKTPSLFKLTQKKKGEKKWRKGKKEADLNGSSIFGRTVPGYIADRVGRFNTQVFMAYLTSILILALWLPSSSNAPLLVFATLYGFSSGAFVSLGPALIAQISKIQEIGICTGTYFAVISFASLTGNPIGGSLISSHQTGRSFWKLQVFGGVVMVVGSTFILMARFRLAGLNPYTKV